MGFIDHHHIVQETNGQRLRHARLCANLTIADIAKVTRIPERYLVAIENDDLTLLPGRIFIFGFSRAFAKVVNIDADAIASRLRTQLTPGQNAA